MTIVPPRGIPGPPGGNAIVWQAIVTVDPAVDDFVDIAVPTEITDLDLVLTANPMGTDGVPATCYAWVDGPGKIVVYLSAGSGAEPVAVAAWRVSS